MFYIIIIIYSFIKIKSCELNGEIEGFCIEKSFIKDETNFCYNFIPKYVCVPFYNPIWPNWTNKTIDETVEKKIVQNIEFEFLTEISNSTYHLPLINTLGCLNSYISFICKKNFLPCEISTDKTYPICKKTCKKFLSKCQTYSNLCDNFPEKNCE